MVSYQLTRRNNGLTLEGVLILIVVEDGLVLIQIIIVMKTTIMS